MKKYFFIVISLSISLLALELTWTRIFSAEFFYTFAFLILSLAVLGLGMGALCLHLFPVLKDDRFLGWLLTLSGLMILVGPPAVFMLELDFSQLLNGWTMVGKLLVTLLLLSSAYFFGGIVLAAIFSEKFRQISQLYMADMTGAGAGVLIAVLLMNWVGTPAAAMLCAFPVLIAAMFTSRAWRCLVPLGLIIILAAALPHADSLLQGNRHERAPVIYSHWDAMAKVKIYNFGDDYYGLNIDNAANSPVYGFDGNWDRPDSMRFQFGIDVSSMVSGKDNCSFLSLGAGGGTDVLQALQAGCTDVHAVEVIPHINELMTEGMLADFSGNIYQDPRVTVITEDARTYVRRHKDRFDFIFSLSSNSFAALASGAFALAENYIFTTEAFQDYWEALTDEGFMMMEHQFYMTRLVSEALNALEQSGVENPRDHIAVYDLPNMRRKILLLSKQVLTPDMTALPFGEFTPDQYEFYSPLYPAPDSLQENSYNRIITDGWEAVQPDLPIDISPCNDNRPFVAQQGLWKNFIWEKTGRIRPYDFFGYPLSKLMMVIILGIVILFIFPINLIPFLKSDTSLRPVPLGYFFLIGAAFMMVEVILIQQFTLFLGTSVISLITILVVLLISSGIGSLHSQRFAGSLPFLVILGWLLLDILVFRHLFYALGDLSFFARVVFCILILSPLGFFMGMPFPLATHRVGSAVSWGFAVNGAASVLGSTLIIMVAISFGFTISLLVAGGLYLLGMLAFNRRSSW